MFDNLQLIPGEAFTALGSVMENLIDKIFNATGMLFVPSDTKKQKQEGEQFLIDKIMEDQNMPNLDKAVCISNVKKIMKKYARSCDVLKMAVSYLTVEPSKEEIDGLDDDWIECFFDKVGNIGKEEMQIVWAKILAKEICEPNSISKHLLHILSIIDIYDARSFTKLSNYCIKLNDQDIAVVYLDEIKSVPEKESELCQGEIFRLEDVGLIQQFDFGLKYTILPDSVKNVSYFDAVIPISNAVTELMMGNVLLSKAGEQLISIISDRTKIEGHEETIRKRLFEDKNKELLDKMNELESKLTRTKERFRQ